VNIILYYVLCRYFRYLGSEDLKVAQAVWLCLTRKVLRLCCAGRRTRLRGMSLQNSKSKATAATWTSASRVALLLTFSGLVVGLAKSDKAAARFLEPLPFSLPRTSRLRRSCRPRNSKATCQVWRHRILFSLLAFTNAFAVRTVLFGAVRVQSRLYVEFSYVEIDHGFVSSLIPSCPSNNNSVTCR